MGQECQSDVTIPARPSPHLVLIEAYFPLGPLERVFNRPPDPGHADQLAQRGCGRSAADVVRYVRRQCQTPAEQQPIPGAGLAYRAQGYPRPLIHPRPLGPIARAESSPLFRRHLCRQCGDRQLRGAPCGKDPHALGALAGQHIRDAALLQPQAE